MESSLQFIYKKEFWYASCFLANANDGVIKAKEIGAMVKDLAANIKPDDLKRVRDEVVKAAIVEMLKSAAIEVTFHTYIPGFMFQEENTEKEYDTLGFLQFEVEYFKDDPDRKAEITPIMIQQIPSLVQGELATFKQREENRAIDIDTESQLFVFVVSDRTTPEEIQWSQENIKAHKQVLAYWNEIYSGAWPDYNEQLYDLRIEKNLSNRLSELHFIRKNSGFIYMAEENYKLFFDSYMHPFVLLPTARIRAMLYALISINHSLDLLFTEMSSKHAIIDLEVLERKIQSLRLLRGLIQTNMSIIYDELDYNRRQHYTAVLTHLIEEFALEGIIGRIGEKFEVIYNALNEIYDKKDDENEKKTQKGVGMLNILFGMSILQTLAALYLTIRDNISANKPLDITINTIVATVISVVLVIAVITILKGKIEARKFGINFTVDAVITDGKGNVLLVKRALPPFKGYHALPGSFIHEKENHVAALKRTCEEELGVKIKIEKKIGVYAKKGRDPRGNVITTAYKCTVTDGLDKVQGELVPVSKLKDIYLAFDHKKILKDAGFS
jgi:8-oxo-dGTP diphosphatase